MRRAIILLSILALLVTGLMVASGSGAGADDAAVNNDLVAVRQTLEHIPVGFRTTCTIVDGQPTLTDLADRIQANISCTASGSDSIYYTKFDSQSDLDSAFEEYLPDTYDSVDQTTGCAESGTYSQGGKTAGRFFCGPLSVGDKTVAAYIWTNNANGLLMSAIRYDEDYQALKAFYEHDAGPTIKATSLGFPVQDSDATQAKLVRSLIAQVPKQTRQFCTTADLTNLNDLGILAQYRAWLRAEVDCRPGNGASVVAYYQVGNRDSLAQMFRNIGSSGIENHNNLPCPTAKPYGRNSHEVGSYACYFTGEKGDSVAVLWTYTPKLILASATRDDTNAKLLLTFWRTQGGPIG